MHAHAQIIINHSFKTAPSHFQVGLGGNGDSPKRLGICYA